MVICIGFPLKVDFKKTRKSFKAPLVIVLLKLHTHTQTHTHLQLETKDGVQKPLFGPILKDIGEENWPCKFHSRVQKGNS